MGFTLIETLVAVSLLVIAIVAPMSLVAQSLSTAVYARDQITAYNLAQEGIEAVRAVRDHNILSNALLGTNIDLLTGIPIAADFVVDATDNTTTTCNGLCPVLKVDPSGQLYGYGVAWTNTRFRRIVHANYVPGPGVSDEIRVTVTIQWDLQNGRKREFKMYSNMYRWVEDGVATGG